MKFIKKVMFLLTCLTLLTMSYYYISVYAYGKKTVNRSADAAVVLGAAAWGVEPSPVFRERINHAIQLYKSKQVKKIIFTGGKRKETDLTESQVAKKYAIKQGVASKDIFIETFSHYTKGNLEETKHIVEKERMQSILIVSDPYHMKRAMKMADDLGLKAYPSPTPTSEFKTKETKFKFLTREVFLYIGYRFFNVQ